MRSKFTNNLPAIRARLRAGASRIVRETVEEIEARIKVSFSEPKHGHTYARGDKTHEASAPGEAPAIDYGFLAGSVQAYMETDTKGGVGVGVEYAPHLELGTSTIEPRPFMVPAAESVSREFQNRLKNLMRS